MRLLTHNISSKRDHETSASKLHGNVGLSITHALFLQ